MPAPELERWALDIIERASKGEPVENARVELKSTWPEPSRAARSVAALANSAPVDGALLLVGVEDTGKVDGIDADQFAPWWSRVKALFGGPVPTVTGQAVSVGDKVVYALLIDGEGGPFVMRDRAGRPHFVRRVGSSTMELRPDELAAAWAQGRIGHGAAQERARVDQLERDLHEAVVARQTAEAEVKRLLEEKRPAEVVVAEIGAAVERERIAKNHELEQLKLQDSATTKRLELENARAIAALEANTKRAVAAETAVEEVRSRAQKRAGFYSCVSAIAGAFLTLVGVFATRSPNTAPSTPPPPAVGPPSSAAATPQQNSVVPTATSLPRVASAIASSVPRACRPAPHPDRESDTAVWSVEIAQATQTDGAMHDAVERAARDARNLLGDEWRFASASLEQPYRELSGGIRHQVWVARWVGLNRTTAEQICMTLDCHGWSGESDGVLRRCRPEGPRTNTGAR
jgi:hypothetical protein